MLGWAMGRGRDVRARDSESCECFEEPANHDPGAIFPGVGRATMAKRPAEVPGQ